VEVREPVLALCSSGSRSRESSSHTRAGLLEELAAEMPANTEINASPTISLPKGDASACLLHRAGQLVPPLGVEDEEQGVTVDIVFREPKRVPALQVSQPDLSQPVRPRRARSTRAHEHAQGTRPVAACRSARDRNRSVDGDLRAVVTRQNDRVHDPSIRVAGAATREQGDPNQHRRDDPHADDLRNPARSTMRGISCATLPWRPRSSVDRAAVS
jgi:hypothetical protein